jgi:UPF0755 protein
MDAPIIQPLGPERRESIAKKALYFVVFCIVSLVVIWFLFLAILQHLDTPPHNFPTGQHVEIQEGMSIKSVSEFLADEHVVRSSLYVYILLTKWHDDALVQAGTYTFAKPTTTTSIVNSLLNGTNITPLISVTFPEGFRVNDLYTYLPDNFEKLPVTDYERYEGYLFPETYFISGDTTLVELVELLLETSTVRHDSLIGATSTNLTKDEVITLASIIEREAKDENSKRIVSGILQNRLRKGMPLQVDATFNYIIGKSSAELTLDDLKIDSPFNTYTHKGLPPRPISNPGEESIRAVLNPKTTEYMYYLTADDGTFYYAKTFEEHKRNKERYLW